MASIVPHDTLGQLRCRGTRGEGGGETKEIRRWGKEEEHSKGKAGKRKENMIEKNYGE